MPPPDPPPDRPEAGTMEDQAESMLPPRAASCPLPLTVPLTMTISVPPVPFSIEPLLTLVPEGLPTPPLAPPAPAPPAPPLDPPAVPVFPEP